MLDIFLYLGNGAVVTVVILWRGFIKVKICNNLVTYIVCAIAVFSGSLLYV